MKDSKNKPISIVVGAAGKTAIEEAIREEAEKCGVSIVNEVNEVEEKQNFPIYDLHGAWDRGPFGARTRPGYTHVREGKKIHNNDLCPCLDGRGLKYKKCCKIKTK